MSRLKPVDTRSACDLFSACAANDPTAWSTFLARYSRAIAAGVRRTLRAVSHDLDPALVDDLVQECYCHLLEAHGRRLSAFQGETDAAARRWLARLAGRLTRDRLRVASASKRGGGRSPIPLTESLRVFASPAPSPEHGLLAREELLHCVRSWRHVPLTERDRRVVRLVYIGGFTSREVAEALPGCLTPSGIDAIVARFRRKLVATDLPAPVRPSARRPRATALAA